MVFILGMIHCLVLKVLKIIDFLQGVPMSCLDAAYNIFYECLKLGLY